MNLSSRPVLAAFLAAAVTPALHGQQARPLVERQKPIPVSTERHLFLDDELVEARAKVVRVMHRPVKQADPVLVGDQPWEKWTELRWTGPSTSTAWRLPRIPRMPMPII